MNAFSSIASMPPSCFCCKCDCGHEPRKEISATRGSATLLRTPHTLFHSFPARQFDFIRFSINQSLIFKASWCTMLRKRAFFPTWLRLLPSYNRLRLGKSVGTRKACPSNAHPMILGRSHACRSLRFGDVKCKGKEYKTSAESKTKPSAKCILLMTNG